jgi:collagenase-like PrtC family protease
MTAVLTLGPVLFNWDSEALRDFYFRIADEAPVDIVHVGEVVCYKRAPFRDRHMPEIVERLGRGGKEVVLSSLALVANDREAAAMEELAQQPEMLVEANDLGMVRALAGRPHTIGPFVNVYSEATLRLLAAGGAVRACLPPELPASSLTALARLSPIPLEVLAFGRIPLAISARCFHARAHGLHKDGCRYVCGEDPDGLDVRTLDGQPFLTVNGTQTLSHTCLDLIRELDALTRAGIARIRLSPQRLDMVAVARVFRDVLDGRIDAGEGESTIACLAPGMTFANGFFHASEGHRYIEALEQNVE